jgi:oxygen-independent coproporphyrinogen-3 oxidase
VKITPEILEQHDKPGPRYTSYPTVPAWNSDFSEPEYGRALHIASQHPDKPIALYVHIPFCEERCWYCGCNVVISKKQEVVEDFLNHIEMELEQVSAMLEKRTLVSQLHWGGGTPTYLTPEQMKRLYAAIEKYFQILPSAEIAIEVDPRVTSEEHLETLRELGFNRISLGVQDLSDEVQKAIGRNQTLEQTKSLVESSRRLGFKSLNIDLIYGLPSQTLERWKQTLEATISLSPDRIAIYSYAHLPDMLKHQRKMNADDLPDTHTKYALMATARDQLQSAGYVSIGMDHFAKATDEMAIAIKEGRLGRNFMGYTTVDAEDMIGIGPSAIGRIGGAFNQNEKRLFKYYKALDSETLATQSGTELTDDDIVRNWVIQQLMCNFVVNFDLFSSRFKLDFESYFAAEMESLGNYVEDRFIIIDDKEIRITPLGQVFIRNIAMVFDAYLRSKSKTARFSRTI